MNATKLERPRHLELMATLSPMNLRGMPGREVKKLALYALGLEVALGEVRRELRLSMDPGRALSLAAAALTQVPQTEAYER